jgi:hypothetical protein
MVAFVEKAGVRKTSENLSQRLSTYLETVTNPSDIARARPKLRVIAPSRKHITEDDEELHRHVRGLSLVA